MMERKWTHLLKGLKNLLGVGPHLILLGLLLEVLTFVVRSRISFPVSIAASTRIILTAILLAVCSAGMAWFNRTLDLIDVNLRSGDNRLITRGPFNYVRHPLYATLLLTLPPLLILWCRDLLFFIPWILLVALAHFVVKREELGLLRTFGKEYAAYRRYVPALLPCKGTAGKRFRKHYAGGGGASGGQPA